MLGIQDASTVLQCYRHFLHHGTPSRNDIARYLLSNGMPFRTWRRRVSTTLPRSHISAPTSIPPSLRFANPADPADRVGLGWRHPNYQPNTEDYTSYEEARAALLTETHARAALLTGGIIWRLAVDTLGFDMVLIGPNDDTAESMYIIKQDDLPGWEFFDDKLSDDELLIISGVYKAYTGRFLLSPYVFNPHFSLQAMVNKHRTCHGGQNRQLGRKVG